MNICVMATMKSGGRMDALFFVLLCVFSSPISSFHPFSGSLFTNPSHFPDSRLLRPLSQSALPSAFPSEATSPSVVVAPSGKIESGDNDSYAATRETLQKRFLELQAEKEKKQIELFSTELALKEISLQMQNASLSVDGGNGLGCGTGKVFDYGFISRSQGYSLARMKSLQSSSVPPNALLLSIDNFQREWNYLLDSIHLLPRNRTQSAVKDEDENRRRLQLLTLSNEKIWQREFQREKIKSPWIIKVPYFVLCWFLDALFDGKPIARFYFLETVARMPYFSYITMLHTYETLGWWRRSTEAKRVHFAEEFNEFHHLLIWESLGGDQEWFVRFFAKHASIVYFFLLIIMWVLSPSLAYNFSELIEAHAVDTYSEFADANKVLLQNMAAPIIAKQYYEAPDLYVFDEFQTNRPKGSRRPIITNLYDVVCNIRDDEAEHVHTMRQCQDPQAVVRSPNTEAAALLALSAGLIVAAIINKSPETEQTLRDLIDNLWRSISSGTSTVTNTVAENNLLSEDKIPRVDEGVMLTSETAAASFSSFISELATKLLRLIR